MKNQNISGDTAASETKTSSSLQIVPHHGNGEPWRTKKEVAAHYGMCARTIERAVAEELDPMPHRRFRGRIMFQFSTIDHWLTSSQKYRIATRGGKRTPKHQLPVTPCFSKVPPARPTTKTVSTVSRGEPRIVCIPVLDGPQIVGSASPPLPRPPSPNSQPSKCKHKFPPGLYSRTCSKCGLTQHKDPATGTWIPSP